jgi:MFS family permease
MTSTDQGAIMPATPAPPGDKLSEKDKIQIIMAEYAALRSEIMTRTGYGFQVAAVAAATITWLVQQQLSHPLPWYLWIVIFLVAVCVGIAIFVNVRDLTRAAKGAKQLEHEVNCRAGEHLLVWETLSGVLTKMGLIRSFFSMATPSSRSELPPLDPSYRRPAPIPEKY